MKPTFAFLATGIALTEEGAWRLAQDAIDQSVAP